MDTQTIINLSKFDETHQSKSKDKKKYRKPLFSWL